MILFWSAPEALRKANLSFLTGVIDEAKIYDYALSDKELNSLYKTGIAKPEIE